MSDTWGDRFARQAAAEWAELDSALPEGARSASGPSDASVVAVVEPGTPAEGQAPLSAAATEALAKAFGALDADWSEVRVVPATRGPDEPSVGWPLILAWEVEIVDPEVVLVFGAAAARVAETAWPKSPAPEPWRARGRPVHMLPDIEDALGTEKGKRALWTALKGLKGALPV